MNLARLVSFFASSPAAKLLRSSHAAYVVFFLLSRFKNDGLATVPHSELLEQLIDFQESVHTTDPDILTDKAEAYLTHWSTGLPSATRTGTSGVGMFE